MCLCVEGRAEWSSGETSGGSMEGGPVRLHWGAERKFGFCSCISAQ